MLRIFLVFTCLVFTAVTLSGCPSNSAVKVYVVPSNNGVQDGTSWATGYTSIQTAIDDAYAREIASGNTIQCEVWIKKGTYSERVILRPAISVFGNFVGNETLAESWVKPDPTTKIDPQTIIRWNGYETDYVVQTTTASILCGITVDGDYNSRCIYIQNAGAPGTILKDCAIKNGAPDYGEQGGGIYGINSQLQMQKCRIYNNTSTIQGGGIFLDVDDEELEIEYQIDQCLFDHNQATFGPTDGQGGAGVIFHFANLVINNTLFEYNSAKDMGALRIHGISQSTASITGCDFKVNTAVYLYGAIYSEFNNTTIENCKFLENTSRYGNGAVSFGQSAGLMLKRSFFYRNVADNGGALFPRKSAIIENCVFAQNQAYNSGGAILSSSLFGITINNCTFTKNKSNIDGINGGVGGAIATAGSLLNINNSIVYDNYITEIVKDQTATVNISYSNIKYGWTGIGNINLDPQFVDPPSTLLDLTFDLKLKTSPLSPSINSASASHAPSVDILNITRPLGVADDMGAYECM